jgi:hypothetical protein
MNSPFRIDVPGPGIFTQLPVLTDNSRQAGRESPHSGNRGYHVVSQRASRFPGGDRRRDAGREPSAWNLPHSLAGSPGDGRILRPGHRYPASAPTGDGCPRLAGPASCGTCRTDIGPVPSGPHEEPSDKGESAIARYGKRKMARLGGLEPPTRCLEGSCSIRLSYRRAK